MSPISQLSKPRSRFSATAGIRRGNRVKAQIHNRHILQSLQGSSSTVYGKKAPGEVEILLHMSARGHIPSSFEGRAIQAPGMMRHGPFLGMGPSAGQRHLDPLPPELLENKVAIQAAEMDRLVRENQRLAGTHVALREELVAARHEMQRLQAHIGSIQTESDIQIRVLLDKISKMEAEVRASEGIKTELQQAHLEAQSLIAARKELNAQIQHATQELQKTLSEVKELPEMHAELDSLREEHQRLRATFEYEKGLNIEKVEQMQGMERNLVSMAREVEKLRAEVLHVENRGRAPNPYGGMYGTLDPSLPHTPQGGGLYMDGYGKPQVQMGGRAGEGTHIYGSTSNNGGGGGGVASVSGTTGAGASVGGTTGAGTGAGTPASNGGSGSLGGSYDAMRGAPSVSRRTRSTVEDRFTRPQRLVRETSDFDYKKLRKLILSEKLAPCFDGVEETNNPDLEECPICFFNFPSLNRSKCCMKGICTECFLQMKPSSATLYAQCPFCKTPSYAVDYRGAKTREEKGLEQAEEQKVIEAKIRMQQRESQDGNQVILVNQNSPPVEVQSTILGSMEPSNGGEQNLRDSELSFSGGIVEDAGSPVNAWNERREEFGLDFEEIMMMEAIWQSIQDTTSMVKCTAQQSSRSNDAVGEIQRSNQGFASLASINQEGLRSTGSVTGGVAVAIARMAERNILHPEISQSIHDNEMVQSQNENSVGESHTLSPIFRGSEMLEVGPVTSDMEPDSDDVNSENACPANCYSTTEDDSWGLHSAYSLNGSQCSSDRSISDDELAPEDSLDVESSCLSSVHTISDLSCGSPDCSDTSGRPTDSHLSVERHHREFSNHDCDSIPHFRSY
ncbi:hypothetical protein NE237_025252 [Protea cynaroides]|uniref:RING-type domain-containing protein n=1 Tax=Protea cynaroides TaxID=273540 RepID=A0A9Q0JZY9_9MAGN|nr:hypothetical protein NE237_025252 [Protea cynaroides]